MSFFQKPQKYFIITILSFTVLIFTFCTPFTAAAQNNAEEYKIGVGDTLRINTWKEPDFSLEAAMVRSDGIITFPLLDDIKAQGLTTMELKAKIEKKLTEYVEAPNVTITLADPVSQKFYILGEIRGTGEYPISKNLTVMQAFALAGGFTEWASKNEILLIRRSDGQKTTITIRYKDILKGDFSKDIALKADDTIIVP
ncbi:MAG: polysaccharide export protein [Deltaproteobacteria bacterium]|jgi:polysaccharide export outer membrane protein|nr:polysaccharide export protein [Deltaproteobacteria bacterium]